MVVGGVDKKKLLIVLAVGVIIAVGASAYNIGLCFGYKRGQLDYAQHRLRYTVIDGQMIEFLGALPKKESVSK